MSSSHSVKNHKFCLFLICMSLSNPDQGTNTDTPTSEHLTSEHSKCMDLPTEKIMWQLVESYFRLRHLNQSKLHSFDELVSEALKTIVHHASPFIVLWKTQWHCFEFKNFS